MTLAVASIGYNARFVRSSIIGAMVQQHVITARAKGISRARVFVRHVVRNALLPILTIVGLQIGHLLSGAVFVETVFSRPGVGRLLVQSILAHDYPTVQAVVLIIAIIYAVTNFIVDMLYPFSIPASHIASERSTMQVQAEMEGSSQRPPLGSKGLVQLKVEAEAPKSTAEPLTPRKALGRQIIRALTHRSLALGLTICLVLIILVAAAPLLTSVNPSSQDPMHTFSPPSLTYLMGTDAFGRDLFARVLYGGRTTMLASLCVVLLGCVFGTTIGLAAGYFGGAFGFCVMRIVDLLLAFPGILLALAVTAILGPGLINGVIAIAGVVIPVYARLVEGATTEIRNLPYVDSAITLGAGPLWIIGRHILPNVLSGVVVLTTTWIGIAALWIAALGFIGLGVQPPMPELGTILSDSQNFITLAWWITFFPGVFLSLFVVGVNLIGDGLRDEFDPTLARA
ncbi:ABC transporter permease subunit [Bradyrhizobium sp. TZ2]